MWLQQTQSALVVRFNFQISSILPLSCNSYWVFFSFGELFKRVSLIVLSFFPFCFCSWTLYFSTVIVSEAICMFWLLWLSGCYKVCLVILHCPLFYIIPSVPCSISETADIHLHSNCFLDVRIIFVFIFIFEAWRESDNNASLWCRELFQLNWSQLLFRK